MAELGEALDHVGGRDPLDRTGAREAVAVADEEHPVGSGDQERIDLSRKPGGVGDDPLADLGHARVAVTSWEIPVLSRARSTSSKPAAANDANMTSGAGR